ncbi:membrane protein [uncultured Mediterranean phage]|nr:membrane protein [uncultured Mediterranean phage]
MNFSTKNVSLIDEKKEEKNMDNPENDSNSSKKSDVKADWDGIKKSTTNVCKSIIESFVVAFILSIFSGSILHLFTLNNELIDRIFPGGCSNKSSKNDSSKNGVELSQRGGSSNPPQSLYSFLNNSGKDTLYQSLLNMVDEFCASVSKFNDTRNEKVKDAWDRFMESNIFEPYKKVGPILTILTQRLFQFFVLMVAGAPLLLLGNITREIFRANFCLMNYLLKNGSSIRSTVSKNSEERSKLKLFLFSLIPALPFFIAGGNIGVSIQYILLLFVGITAFGTLKAIFKLLWPDETADPAKCGGRAAPVLTFISLIVSLFIYLGYAGISGLLISTIIMLIIPVIIAFADSNNWLSLMSGSGIGFFIFFNILIAKILFNDGINDYIRWAVVVFTMALQGTYFFKKFL